MTRIRTQAPSVPSGTITDPGGNVSVKFKRGHYAQCEDVVGLYGTVNPLRIEKATIGQPGLVEGSNYGYNFSYSPDLTKVGTLGFLNDPQGLTDYTNRILANGPKKPHVNLPLFIFEMKDIPRMLQHAVHLLRKIDPQKTARYLSPDQEVASATLAYNFGWEPLVSDIIKMFQFQEAVDRRMRNIHRALDEGSYKSRTQLGSGSDSVTVSDVVESGIANAVCQCTVSRSYSSWGTVRWKPRADQDLGTLASPGYAWRQITGLNPANIPTTVWKALPFSWMADWFTDTSNFLQANQNRLDWVPHMGSLMSTSTVVRHWEPAGHMTEPGSVTWVKKTRVAVPSHPAIRIKLPILDDFKLAILGSMAITRSGYRS